jgi:hypothetical protein
MMTTFAVCALDLWPDIEVQSGTWYFVLCTWSFDI